MGASRGLCAPHHVTGEWYFILKHGLNTNIVMNLYSLLRRQILNKINIKYPINIPKSIYRSAVCFYYALNQKKEPKDLNNKNVLNEIFDDIEVVYEKNINNK